MNYNHQWFALVDGASGDCWEVVVKSAQSHEWSL